MGVVALQEVAAEVEVAADGRPSPDPKTPLGTIQIAGRDLLQTLQNGGSLLILDHRGDVECTVV